MDKELDVKVPELSGKILKTMSESEVKRYYDDLASRKKLQAFASDIMKECQKQDFTISEFGNLASILQLQHERMIKNCEKRTKIF